MEIDYWAKAKSHGNFCSFVDKDMEYIIGKTYNYFRNQLVGDIVMNRVHRYIHHLEKVYLKDIDWIGYCDFMEKARYKKFLAGLFCMIYKEGLYAGSYKKELADVIPVIWEYANQPRQGRFFDNIICGDKIDKLVIVRNKNLRMTFTSILFPEGHKEMIQEIAEGTVMFSNWAEYIYELENSLPNPSAIKSIFDLNGDTFWHQVKYFKEKFKDQETTYRDFLFCVTKTYRDIINNHPGHDPFKKCHNMSKTLISADRAALYILNNAYFGSFGIHDDIPNLVNEYDKYVFILRGYEKTSTRLKPDDFIYLDLSKLHSRFYKELLLKYWLNACTIPTIMAFKPPQIEAFSLLENVKNEEKYPNPDLSIINDAESFLLKEHFIKTKNDWQQKVNAVKAALKWGKDAGLLNCDGNVFTYLKTSKRDQTTGGNSIPDEDLVKIKRAFLSETNKDLRIYVAHAIFQILIEAEFRISQVCNIQTEDIHPTVKKGQYYLSARTKTSAQSEEKMILSTSTYQLLCDVIDKTDSLRKDARSDVEPYVFIYKNKRGNIVRMNNDAFGDVFSNICKAAGVGPYNCGNLRDTHMTKAYEHVIRTGKSDLELLVLAHHTNVDVTKNHYIEKKLEDMLEASYGVTIGVVDYDTKDHVVESVDNKYTGADCIVEHGCGNCVSDRGCVNTTALPCFLCQWFYTTIQHKPFFEKEIESVDNRIKNAEFRHDKEDLVYVKTLLVSYLKEIMLKEELQEDENGNDI